MIRKYKTIREQKIEKACDEILYGKRTHDTFRRGVRRQFDLRQGLKSDNRRHQWERVVALKDSSHQMKSGTR